MKERIGILLPSINAGGAERAATRITQILSKDYEVYLIVFSDEFIKYDFSGELINLGIPFVKTNNFLKKLFVFVKRILKLKKVKKDLKLKGVISFMDTPNIVNVMSKTKGCFVATSIRNYDFLNKNALSKYFYNYIHKKSDVIITVSMYIKNSFCKNYNIDVNKVKVIYNPYDINLLEKESKKNLVDSDKIYEDSSLFRFVTVGRMAYQKGFWHLIKSFKEVNEVYPHTELIIVGRDETNGKALRLVKELGLQGKVKMLGYQENPFAHIEKCDVYVLTSLFEGFPNSLVEAMALKKAVIASNCESGPSEILDNKIEVNIEKPYVGKYGILVPKLEAEEDWEESNLSFGESNLTEAMLMIIDNEKLRNTISKKSYERASQFNYKVCGELYKNEINKLL